MTYAHLNAHEAQIIPVVHGPRGIDGHERDGAPGR